LVLATDVCILIVHIVLNKDYLSLKVLDARADVRILRLSKDCPIVPEVDEACSAYITILKQNRGNVISRDDPSNDLRKAYKEFWCEMAAFYDWYMEGFYD
jgi:hypothetical protein